MYENAKEYLTGFGIRPSLQRMAVMDYLMTYRNHPTAEQIHSALVTTHPTLSRATIYNTLSALSRCGAIQLLDLDGVSSHYDGNTTPHAHFLCTRCGHIIDIFAEMDTWWKMISAVPPPGASFSGVQLILKGLCPKCNKTNN